MNIHDRRLIEDYVRNRRHYVQDRQSHRSGRSTRRNAGILPAG